MHARARTRTQTVDKILPKIISHKLALIINIISEATKTWSQGYKIFSMLNSAEHEIINVHKYKNSKKFSTVLG